jgi:hypothetical protein
MSESDTANSVVVDRFTSARHIVYIHTEGMANTMRKEGGRNTRCEDSLL